MKTREKKNELAAQQASEAEVQRFADELMRTMPGNPRQPFMAKRDKQVKKRPQ